MKNAQKNKTKKQNQEEGKKKINPPPLENFQNIFQQNHQIFSRLD